ncbi:MAG: glutathione S-transferase family protein [Kiloniellales bacterium]
MALIFYYGSGSPFAWKVWLTLEHKGIPYELKVLSFDRDETRAPAFLAVNPRGQVPAIVDDGFALWESAVICEYLEERFPEPALLPGDANARAIARRIAAEGDGDLYAAVSALSRMAFSRKEPASPAEIAQAQQGVMEELARFEALFVGPHLAGPLSLADFTAFPHVRLLQRIEQRQPGNGIAAGRLPPKLRAWVKRIEALPCYEKTIPPHWKE